jgi:anti-sigma regulatory factor (Ser/Thr protein kinase)
VTRSLRLAATLASLDSVAEYAADLALLAGFAEADAYRLRLVLDEVFTNIATHGQDGASGGEVELAGATRNGQVVLTVTDWCRPFDPRCPGVAAPAAPPAGADCEPGGYGLILLRRLADSLDYQRADDQNRTTIVLRPAGQSTVDGGGGGTV